MVSHFQVLQNIVDAVGAGDALLAYSSLALFSTKSLLHASILGSIALHVNVKDGNITVNPNEIIEKLDELEISTKYQSSNGHKIK